MLLTNFQPAPSGMSFVFDTGPSPRRAYVISTPGTHAVITVQGVGGWAIEILSSLDGVNFSPVATNKTTPGQWRYDTLGAVAFAVRVAAFTGGNVSGMLTHGGAAPITNVSSLFGAFLIFSYNATAAEPPVGNQIRFNSATLPQVTKAWIRNTTVDGTDQFQALRKIPSGGTILVQDRDNHSNAVLLDIVGPVVDKGAYVEIPVIYQEHQGVLASAQTLVAIFNPGPILSLVPTVPTQLPTVHPPPVLTSLDPSAAPLGSPNFTLHVRGTGFAGDDVIRWNGGVEPTTFVSSEELTTGVNMATAQVVLPIEVAVETTRGLVSNALIFDLGGFPPAPPPAAPAPTAEPPCDPPRRRKVAHDG